MIASSLAFLSESFYSRERLLLCIITGYVGMFSIEGLVPGEIMLFDSWDYFRRFYRRLRNGQTEFGTHTAQFAS